MYSPTYIDRKLEERKEKVDQAVYEYLLYEQKRKEIDLKTQFMWFQWFGRRPENDLVPEFNIPTCPKRLGQNLRLKAIIDDLPLQEIRLKEALKVVGCWPKEYVNPYKNITVDVMHMNNENKMLEQLFQNFAEQTKELLSLRVPGFDRTSPAWQRFQEKVAEFKQTGEAAGYGLEPLPELIINMLATQVEQLRAEIQELKNHTTPPKN